MNRTLAIETGIEEEYEQALIASAKKLGWKVESIQGAPFSEEDPQFFYRDATGLLPDKPVSKKVLTNPNTWYHGSIQTAKLAQAGTAWQVHAPWQDLRCSSYYKVLAGNIFQEDAVFTTLKDFYQDHEDLFRSSLVEDASLFVRPDGNDKLFTGGCISKDDFEHGYQLMVFYEPPPETPIVIARPQRILAEARFLVVGGKLITGSYYRTGKARLRLAASPDLLSIAEKHLQFCLDRGFDPAPSWVLDLAQNAEGTWKIIEVGATSCCGLYKCNTDAFLKALDGVLKS